MKLIHSALTSAVFTLVKTVEVDIRLGDDSWTTRIKVFQDSTAPTQFRCRWWQSELFRLTPTFPHDAANQPLHHTDDNLFVERALPRATRTSRPFAAATANDALDLALDDLKAFLEHVSDEAAH